MFRPMAHHPHVMAAGLASLGRGGDSTLVHMSPGEVQSLHHMASLAGGGITTNPHTGLPEAGFLSSLLPMLAGGLMTLVTGGMAAPLAMALQGGAGLAAGALKGDRGIGLFGDVLGGIGGGGLANSIMNSGLNAATQGATNSILADNAATAGAEGAATNAATAGAEGAATNTAGSLGNWSQATADKVASMNLMSDPSAAGRWAALKGGMSALGPGGSASGLGFLQSNAGNILKAAAPALAGGTAGSPNIPTPKVGPYYNTTFQGKVTYGPGGQPIYSGSYTPGAWSTNYMGQGYRPTVGTGQTTEKGPLGSFENPYAGIATLTPTYDPYTGLPTNQVPGMKHGGAVAHYATGGASVPAETGQGMLNALPALPAAQPGNNQAILESMNKMFSGMASTSPPAPQSPAAMNDYMSSLMATPYNPNWTGPASAPASTPTTPPPGGKPPTTPPGLPKFPGGNLADLLNYTANSGGGANAAMPQYTYDPVTGQYTQQGGGLDFLRGGIHMAHGGMLDGSTYAEGGKLLTGDGDGMSDSIEAVIHGDKPQRAALADGEFVVPADVVSHLGNGSTSAGAKKLYAMMDKVRMARTGNPNQGKQINSDKYLPA